MCSGQISTIFFFAAIYNIAYFLLPPPSAQRPPPTPRQCRPTSSMVCSPLPPNWGEEEALGSRQPISPTHSKGSLTIDFNISNLITHKVTCCKT